MPPHSLDLAAQTVLGRYPCLPNARIVALGNRGGFSGARLWQIHTDAGWYCLRAWPPRGPGTTALSGIHCLMMLARNAGLAFVPGILRTSDGTSWVTTAGRLWDLTDWMPGRADFHGQRTTVRLTAACTALAQIHTAWAQVGAGGGPCPAVQRRLKSCSEWRDLIRSGWRPAFSEWPPDPVRPCAERAFTLLRERIDEVPSQLAFAVNVQLPLQPCLCDVWHDHVLFEGDVVTGLVDYGSVKVDHVAVDLARLLGSLVGDDVRQYAAGLEAYETVRPVSTIERQLVAALDRTGTLLGAANWLRWLYHEGRQYEDREAVARRLATLVERIERWE